MPEMSPVVTTCDTAGVVLFSLQAVVPDMQVNRRMMISAVAGPLQLRVMLQRSPMTSAMPPGAFRRVLPIFEGDRLELGRLQREARQWLCRRLVEGG